MHYSNHSKRAGKTTTWTPNIGTTGVDKIEEWCNSFVKGPKPNSTVCLYLDSIWLISALIRPVHRGSTIEDILPKLTNVCYMNLIDASLGYHNLKLKISSYFTMSACQFGRYRFTRLPFKVMPALDMFQWKIYEISKTFHMVFVL